MFKLYWFQAGFAQIKVDIYTHVHVKIFTMCSSILNSISTNASAPIYQIKLDAFFKNIIFFSQLRLFTSINYIFIIFLLTLNNYKKWKNITISWIWGYIQVWRCLHSTITKHTWSIVFLELCIYFYVKIWAYLWARVLAQVWQY